MSQIVNSPARLLVVSDQAGFFRDLVARWQMQSQVPEFTAVNSDLLRSAGSLFFEIAIAGDMQSPRAHEVRMLLNRGSAPAVYVSASGESVHGLRREYPRLTVIPRHDAWLDTLVLVTEEILKRREISAHIQRLEQNARAQEAHAVLGKYMSEMRHGFNNALTSVLGNAELLMLQAAGLEPAMREQLETLHAMTLRLHEMMQRFTSLELEMQRAEKTARSEKNLDALTFAARA
jgi:signal transduction histidine kinase